MPDQKAEQLRAGFCKIFNPAQRKITLVKAPGRINLIGEHTDYNEGFVFPAAVNKATYVAAQRRNDTKVVVYSATVEEKIEFDVKFMKFDSEHGWANYPKAVLHALVNRGWKLDGLNIYLESDVPMGGGMSSSAALECAIAHACLALFPYRLDRMAVTRLCQRAENQFIGVACGIMDQYASNFGRRGQGLVLDCRSLKCEYVPLPAEYRFLLVNSGVKRKLAGAEYNRRREQCTEALKLLKPKFPQAKALRDITVADLSQALPLLPDILKKRVEHVVRECGRVREAVEALKAGSYSRFGSFIADSHRSLRDLYEVSCPELDTLADAAANCSGVLGARMMGGGFGGCVIAMVAGAAVESARRDIGRIYRRRYGTDPEMYDVEADDGARELNV